MVGVYQKMTNPRPIKVEGGWKCPICGLIRPKATGLGKHIAKHFPNGVPNYKVNQEKIDFVKPLPIVLEVKSEDGKLVPKMFQYYPRKIDGTTDLELLEELLNKGKNILLKGATGSGKTALVRYYCALHNKPYLRISLSGGTTVEDLVGHYILKDHETKWVDGLLTLAVRNGYVVVIDELNAAEPEILFVMNALLDEERRLILIQKDGEIVEPHPDFRLVCTLNPSELGYAGTKELNEAQADRFIHIPIDYSSSAENKIIQKTELSEEDKSKIKRFLIRIREAHEKGEINTPFSTRSLIEFVDLVKNKRQNLISFRFSKFEQKVVQDLLQLYWEK